MNATSLLILSQIVFKDLVLEQPMMNERYQKTTLNSYKDSDLNVQHLSLETNDQESSTPIFHGLESRKKFRSVIREKYEDGKMVQLPLIVPFTESERKHFGRKLLSVLQTADNESFIKCVQKYFMFVFMTSAIVMFCSVVNF